MISHVRIVSERGTLRMIYCRALGYAVVEMRDGYVYSADPHHKCRAPDTAKGMQEVASVTGWTSEQNARRQFEELVDAGQRLARKIW